MSLVAASAPAAAADRAGRPASGPPAAPVTSPAPSPAPASAVDPSRLTLPPIELGRGPLVIPALKQARFAGSPPLGLYVGLRLGLGFDGRLSGPNPGAAFLLDLALQATYGGQYGDRPWLLRLEAAYSLTAPPLEHTFAVGPSLARAIVHNEWSTAWIFTFGPRFAAARIAAPSDSWGLGFRYGGTVEAITFNGNRSSALFGAADLSHQVLFAGPFVRNDLRLMLAGGLAWGSEKKR